MQVSGRRTEREGEEIRAISVYAHVPYCLSKCPYCDFNSIPLATPPEDNYVNALIAELFHETAHGLFRSLRGAPLKSLYFGGGTPTLFTPKAIGRVINAAREVFSVAPETEITIEANPATIDARSLALLREAGVNRLSIGVQSFSVETLKTLGRAHDCEDAVRALDSAREAGFDNVCADLIFAVPGQTRQSFLHDLQRLVKFAPSHISIYGMTIEESTPFGRAFKAGGLEPVVDEIEAGMYEDAVTILAKNGYARYEISNFALPGKQSAHNRGYWEGRDYLGLGAGAHSYLAHCESDCASGAGSYGERKWNVDGPDKYMELIKNFGSATCGAETLTKDEAMTEALYLGLRTTGGVDAARFKARFGVEPEAAFTQKSIFTKGLVERIGSDLKLTDKGVLLANEVF